MNLSVKQVIQPDLVEQIARILDKTNLEPCNLKLEITENMLMKATESVADVMHQLKALEILLSLNDFGTGYSSLSSLHCFPIDTLKIDRSFVSGIDNASESWKIVRAIAMMAQALVWM